MTIQYGRMKEGQEADVARLIRTLIDNYGRDFETEISEQSLRDSQGFLNVEIAESDSGICGFCAWVMTYSTWRGMKGIYIADLNVSSTAAQSEIGRELLTLAAKNGAKLGARFIRTEVDVSDEVIESVFQQANFWSQTRHSVYFLEPKDFRELVA